MLRVKKRKGAGKERGDLFSLLSLYIRDLFWFDTFPLSCDGFENITASIQQWQQFVVSREMCNDAQFQLGVVCSDQNTTWIEVKRYVSIAKFYNILYTEEWVIRSFIQAPFQHTIKTLRVAYLHEKMLLLERWNILVQCSAVVTRSIFSQILTIDTP